MTNTYDNLLNKTKQDVQLLREATLMQEANTTQVLLEYAQHLLDNIQNDLDELGLVMEETNES